MHELEALQNILCAIAAGILIHLH